MNWLEATTISDTWTLVATEGSTQHIIVPLPTGAANAAFFRGRSQRPGQSRDWEHFAPMHSTPTLGLRSMAAATRRRSCAYFHFSRQFPCS